MSETQQHIPSAVAKRIAERARPYAPEGKDAVARIVDEELAAHVSNLLAIYAQTAINEPAVRELVLFAQKFYHELKKRKEVQ